MNIALIGNCQVRTYAKILSDALPVCDLHVLDFSTTESREERVRQSFIASLRECNLVLVQPNGLSSTRPSDLKANLGLCNSSVIVISNLFFRGLHPDMCYVGPFGKRIGWNDYHSLICLEGYKADILPAEAISHLSHGKISDSRILDAWDKSIEELTRRDQSVDFPAASLVDECCRAYQAFWTINHPTIWILQEYIYSLLASLEIAYVPTIYRAKDDPLSFIQYPVYDFWAEKMSLDYRTSQKLRIKKTFFTLGEFYELSYQTYVQEPIEDLIVNSPSDLAS